jgi:hypothetical protein
MQVLGYLAVLTASGRHQHRLAAIAQVALRRGCEDLLQLLSLRVRERDPDHPNLACPWVMSFPYSVITSGAFCMNRIRHQYQCFLSREIWPLTVAADDESVIEQEKRWLE